MLKAIISVFVLGSAVSLNAQTVKPIYVVHVNLGNNQLAQNIEDELVRTNPDFKNRPVVILRPNLDNQDNPFSVSKWGRQTGLTRPGNEIAYEKTPVLTEKMEQWFEDLEKKGIHPEIFIVNGHHLVGMGFESDNTWETNYMSQFRNPIELSKRNLYFPSVIRSKNYFPAVKRFFDGIKLVFIGGCEGLADLEPKENGSSGRALTPQEIKARYFGGQKALMLGNISKGEGLAGYKADLVRVYPGSYTDKADEEVCVDSANRLHCEVFDVNRILPDSGLWDGLHTYNMPYQMKRAFPNAYAIFGFATPSPLSPGPIWKAAFNMARVNLGKQNIMQPLLTDTTSTDEKKRIVQNLRISWTKSTQQMNKRIRNGKTVNRISGSITPAFPELDASGIFAYDVGVKDFPEGPAFAPYEVRDGSEKKLPSSFSVDRSTDKPGEKATSSAASVNVKKEQSTIYTSEPEDPLGEFIKNLEKEKTR